MDKGKRNSKDIEESRVSDPDPYCIRILIVNGFNRNSESGSVFGIQIRYGSGRAKMTHKSRKNLEVSCFEVLDVFFRELKASFVTWTSFMEA